MRIPVQGIAGHEPGIEPCRPMGNDVFDAKARVANKAKELNIELLYLPPYSPNLNLIERLWLFVKKQVLYSKHYDRFDAFRNSINTCITELGTRYKNLTTSYVKISFSNLDIMPQSVFLIDYGWFREVELMSHKRDIANSRQFD